MGLVLDYRQGVKGFWRLTVVVVELVDILTS